MLLTRGGEEPCSRRLWPTDTIQKMEIVSGFSVPYGVAVDGGGSIYVEDAGSKAVFKETPAPVGYTQTTIVSGLINP